ncbi:hypothetical protein PHYPSEUDO_005285 [Phytophthora pseudosyringae]|uniref:Uncharacterized protein n=1 Tax=Phytophthora pseudosyringae TaxID=221518 RepID=A0A8T1WD77_9STRA|nr:hypothetical protein PHYPSEUDO_005285 [Phytophthora pseudosyringae]
MARAEDQPPSDGSDRGSDSDSGYSSGYDSEDGSGEEEEGDQDVEAAAAAKKQRVRGDIDEMHRMMADMDAIKTRLQQRFAAERQARAERLARDDREREVQDAARRKAEEEASGRQVEASVQTETDPTASRQQVHLPQQSVCPPHVVDDAAAAATGASALPAVDGGTGFADSAAKAAPNKAKPAGLSLYDLVKVSGLELTRKARSPVRRADRPEELPTRPSNEHERVPPEQHQRQLHGEQQDPGVEQVWCGGDSLLAHDQDSVVGGGHDGSDNDSYGSSRQSSSLNSMRSHPRQPKGEQSLSPSRHYDENWASVSNSLVSSDAGNRSAVFPDLIQRRDHTFNAAALLSTGKRPPPTTNNGDESKTDEQRETEAIRCLLFGHR